MIPFRAPDARIGSEGYVQRMFVQSDETAIVVAIWDAIRLSTSEIQEETSRAMVQAIHARLAKKSSCLVSLKLRILDEA
ncbi:hypothetical protein RclHR1_05100001 [Rhizophagus clarus]|uniref:Uncharacterized protein n=1 Tax=Rhizophagus clarus TaxID=94130 RepID=A0A2Z6RYE7_9GLOM|nr:hypothetical protein RclHR1_05100001 [Rhizophagus clarus]GES86430.1 hypothetical protein RCL_jg18539.t1 [Rhizophagus clarus]